jgi:hypothetical protein
MLPNRKNLRGALHTSSVRTATSANQRGALHTSSVRTATSANQFGLCRPNTLGYGRLAQLGERLPYKQEVACSSHAPPTL